MKLRNLALAVSLALATPLAAQASTFQIMDHSSNEQLHLIVDGVVHDSNFSNSYFDIQNFSIDNAFKTIGERMQFDYIAHGAANSMSDGQTVYTDMIYTRLLGAADEPGMISDELVVRYLGLNSQNRGVFHVDFISYDSVDGVMASYYYGSLPPPSALTATEIPAYQLMAQIGYEFAPGGYFSYADISVMSIPEPGSMALLGLAGLAGTFARRRKA